MTKRSGVYPRLSVDAGGGSAVSQAGGVLLTATVRAAGLDVALSEALSPWRAPLARHDPAKVLLDLAFALALGGEACSDLATVRAEPAVFGPVASDPTLSRTITRLPAPPRTTAGRPVTPAQQNQRPRRPTSRDRTSHRSPMKDRG